MGGWQRVTDNVWGCAEHPGRDGKGDFMLEARDGKLWTFGGDRATLWPGPMDNDAWTAGWSW